MQGANKGQFQDVSSDVHRCQTHVPSTVAGLLRVSGF